jgi:hypothetical protein
MHVAFDAARHDLAAAIVPLGEFEDAGNQQGLVHHLPH